MKKFFSKLFNQRKNSGFVKKDTPEREITDVENRLADWLSHPNEYGKRPVYTKVIKTGAFKFVVIPNNPTMNYSLIEYKMTVDSKIEIGIVDEMHVWSFLNVLNYEAIGIEELILAYKGKLFEIMDSRFAMMKGKQYSFPIEEERNKITAYFKSMNPNGEFRISDVIIFFRGITFFGFNITNPDNGKNILIPSHYNNKTNKHYDDGFMYEDGHPILPVAMYVKIGHTLTKEIKKE